jgi:hypothetical protein
MTTRIIIEVEEQVPVARDRAALREELTAYCDQRCLVREFAPLSVFLTVRSVQIEEG